MADPDDTREGTSGPPSARRRWRPRLAAALGLAAVVLLGVFGMARVSRAARATRPTGPRAVPVVGATVRRGDLGVYQTGLGTVTALKTATVRSRVDGELVRVAYREGQSVRAGDLLVEIDPRPFQVQLHQAEGQLAKDEAALRNAKVDLERYKASQDIIPRQQLDTQAAAVDQMEASIRSDQAQVESARLSLTYSRIVAPISGIVGLRLVDPGNIVHANDANGLLVVTQQQPISVVFTIASDNLEPVIQQVRARRELVVEAWDRDWKHKLATGSLVAVDNEIDASTGTVRLKAEFSNDDLALYPNQFVNARLLVDTLHQAVLAPTAALQRSPQSTYVWAVKRDGIVDMRTVEVQLTEGDDSAILKGVSPGDVVVVDGVDKLQPGTAVAVAVAGGPGSRKGAS
jgi:membrane fusion protein, multidrug efflux system